MTYIFKKTVKDLNSSKGHDIGLSIGMLKICNDSICAPLEIIFKQALFTGVFPSK